MSATSQVETFVEQHRPCGELTGHASPATADGYHLLLQCACAAEFDHWIPMAEATSFMAGLASQN